MVELPKSLSTNTLPQETKKLKKNKKLNGTMESSKSNKEKKGKKTKSKEPKEMSLNVSDDSLGQQPSPSKKILGKKKKGNKNAAAIDKGDFVEPAKKRKKMSKVVAISDVQDLIETPPISDDDDRSPVEIEGDFGKFRISEDTISLLKEKKITYLFPVQIKTFDHVFDGFDVVAQARTGTGKTLSFALPLVEKLQGQKIRKVQGRPPKVLVMAPTRELALQVFKDFDSITTQLKCLCIYGGTPYYPQERAMRNGLDIVVGTPGRIMDHIRKGNLNIGSVDHVVLDEVDQMLDMGFAPSVEEILQYAYTEERDKPPQTLLFSATCPMWVKKTAGKYMRTEQTHHVDLIGKDTVKTATTVQHLAIRCHYTQRAQCIGDVVQVYSGRHGRTIIFTETKKEANELGLNDAVKVEAQVLHGDIEQRQREITLKAFREGSVKCLVATNVAARGLDIPEVDLVIQINPPKDIESYIHRSGRTGRAGRLGTCVCFYKPNEEDWLRRVERTARIKFKRVGTPQPKDIIQSAYDDAVRSLDAVPETVCSQFLDQAEKVAEKYCGGALEALAAALAHMSGATKLSSRSLLNSQEGFTTWLMTAGFEVRFVGFFFSAIENCLGSEIKSKVQGMRMAKDKMGAVFDLPTELTGTIQEKWQDSDRMKLTEAEHIPELVETENRFGDRRNSGGRGGGGGGRGRDRRYGGGGGRSQRRGGRGRSGFSGFKRSWNN